MGTSENLEWKPTKEALRRSTDALTRRFDSFFNLPVKGFFYGLADYIKAIDTDPALKAAVMVSVLLERDRDKSEYDAAWKEFENEIEVADKKVLGVTTKFPESQKIQSLVKYYLEEKAAFEAGRVTPAEAKLTVLHSQLNDIVHAFVSEGHVEEAKPFVDFDSQGLIVEFITCPSHKKFLEVRKHWERAKERTPWGAWEKLLHVYNLMHRIREMDATAQRAIGERNLLPMIGLNMWAGEFEHALAGNPSAISTTMIAARISLAYTILFSTSFLSSNRDLKNVRTIRPSSFQSKLFTYGLMERDTSS